MDHLGEFVSSREEAIEATEYNVKKTLEAIAKAGVNSNLSVKMTQLGLDIDRDFFVLKKICGKFLRQPKKHNNFVRIDMEDHAHCQITLDILRELRQTYDNVGTVIQAYLYRAEQDVKELKRSFSAFS
ncbi:hypothetical protein GCM10020331_055790 [Ectobacillus funiculus]